MAQILLDTDTFTDTNGTLLSAHFEDGGTWGDYANVEAQIQSNRLTTRAINDNTVQARLGKTWTPDQWAQITYVAFTSYHCGIYLRKQTGANSAYFAGLWSTADASHVCIVRVDTNSPTVLKTTSVTLTSTSTLNAQIVGTVITVTVGANSDSYDTASDSTKYSSGNPGYDASDLGAANVQWADNWQAGSVSAAAAPPDQFVKVEIRAA